MIEHWNLSARDCQCALNTQIRRSSFDEIPLFETSSSTIHAETSRSNDASEYAEASERKSERRVFRRWNETCGSSMETGRDDLRSNLCARADRNDTYTYTVVLNSRYERNEEDSVFGNKRKIGPWWSYEQRTYVRTKIVSRLRWNETVPRTM